METLQDDEGMWEITRKGSRTIKTLVKPTKKKVAPKKKAKK